MKKLVILLLTVFTIGTAAACGCGGEKTNSHDDKNNGEPVRIQEIEGIEEVEQDGQDDGDKKPECPDKSKRDGEFPTPRKPHRRPYKKHPHPKYVYRR